MPYFIITTLQQTALQPCNQFARKNKQKKSLALICEETTPWVLTLLSLQICSTYSTAGLRIHSFSVNKTLTGVTTPVWIFNPISTSALNRPLQFTPGNVHLCVLQLPRWLSRHELDISSSSHLARHIDTNGKRKACPAGVSSDTELWWGCSLSRTVNRTFLFWSRRPLFCLLYGHFHLFLKKLYKDFYFDKTHLHQKIFAIEGEIWSIFKTKHLLC